MGYTGRKLSQIYKFYKENILVFHYVSQNNGYIDYSHAINLELIEIDIVLFTDGFPANEGSNYNFRQSISANFFNNFFDEKIIQR